MSALFLLHIIGFPIKKKKKNQYIYIYKLNKSTSILNFKTKLKKQNYWKAVLQHDASLPAESAKRSFTSFILVKSGIFFGFKHVWKMREGLGNAELQLKGTSW